VLVRRLNGSVRTALAKDPNDIVNYASGLSCRGAGSDGNGLVCGGINGDSLVLTVVRVSGKSVGGAVNNDDVVISVALISCCVNNYGCNVLGNNEGYSTCNGAGTELKDRVTCLVKATCVCLESIGELKGVVAGSEGLGGTDIITIYVSTCSAVCTEVEYDLVALGNLGINSRRLVVRIGLATLALTLNEVVLVRRLGIYGSIRAASALRIEGKLVKVGVGVGVSSGLPFT
jgi:hypothetical protein